MIENLPSVPVGLEVVFDLKTKMASSVAEATMPAMLLKVQAPVIVWVAALLAGPVVQSRLTKAAEPEAVIVNFPPSKERDETLVLYVPGISLTSI